MVVSKSFMFESAISLVGTVYYVKFCVKLPFFALFTVGISSPPSSLNSKHFKLYSFQSSSNISNLFCKRLRSLQPSCLGIYNHFITTQLFLATFPLSPSLISIPWIEIKITIPSDSRSNSQHKCRKVVIVITQIRILNRQYILYIILTPHPRNSNTHKLSIMKEAGTGDFKLASRTFLNSTKEGRLVDVSAILTMLVRNGHYFSSNIYTHMPPPY